MEVWAVGDGGYNYNNAVVRSDGEGSEPVTRSQR